LLCGRKALNEPYTFQAHICHTHEHGTCKIKESKGHTMYVANQTKTRGDLVFPVWRNLSRWAKTSFQISLILLDYFLDNTVLITEGMANTPEITDANC